MAEDFDLIADYREGKGKGASRRLRHEGRVPAIIYGAGRPPRALTFDHNKVLRQLENEAFYSSVLNIKVGDKSQAAIVKDIQRHPSKRQVLHMDFQRVVEDEEIRMNVPLHFLGEKDAPGVKQGGGSVSHLMTDVEVTCLPRYLPEYLEVDVSQLKLDEMLYLSDIQLPEGVALPDLAQGPDNDQPIVSIHIIRAAPIEEEEGEEIAPSDVPTQAEEEQDEESDED